MDADGPSFGRVSYKTERPDVGGTSDSGPDRGGLEDRPRGQRFRGSVGDRRERDSGLGAEYHAEQGAAVF